jgi:hypothetical protein
MQKRKKINVVNIQESNFFVQNGICTGISFHALSVVNKYQGQPGMHISKEEVLEKCVCSTYSLGSACVSVDDFFTPILRIATPLN